MIIASIAGRVRIQSNRQAEVEAKRMASEVFKELADYAADIVYDSSGRDGYISVSQLRDDVLREEFSAKRRTVIWRKVERLVEQNSNVRTKVGVLDSGDVGRGWKWIGPVRPLEDGASGVGSGRRTSSRSRFSLGPVPSSSPVVEIKNTDISPDTSSNSVFARWDDSSRPAY
jgi:hypothetical protein